MNDLHDMWVGLLEVGCSLEELEAKIKFHSPARWTADLIALERMNLIRQLRSEGYDIPKQRGFYKIVGKKEPEPDPVTILDWPDDQRLLLDTLHSLQPVTAENWEGLKTLGLKMYEQHGIPLQQYSPAYMLCYELANDHGWFLPSGGIVAQKFWNQPRLRLMNPQTIEDLEFAEEWMPRVSIRDINIRGLPIHHQEELLLSRGWRKNGFREQGIYDLDGLANWEQFISLTHTRKRSYLRKNLSELQLVRYGGLTDSSLRLMWLNDARQVITTWKNGPGGTKQRALAISRDYVAVDLVEQGFMQDTAYMFYRNGREPVAVMIFDALGTYAVDIASKALNFTELPGGYHSTGTAAIMMMARDLVKQGFHWYQAGGLDGGTDGLYQYKLDLIEATKTPKDVSIVKSLDWYLPNYHFDPQRKSYDPETSTSPDDEHGNSGEAFDYRYDGDERTGSALGQGV